MMKKKRLLLFLPWLLVAALCIPLVGCSSDDEDDGLDEPVIKTYKTYTFDFFKLYGRYQVGYPDLKPSCWKRWLKSGGSFNTYLVQNGRIYDAGIVHSNDTLLTDEERDSKSLTFNVAIPSSLDKDGKVGVIAFCDIEPSLSGGNIECNADLKRKGLIPLYAYADASSVGNVCKSSALTTVELVCVENATSDTITVRHKGFEAKDKWYYSKAKEVLNADATITTKGLSLGDDVVSDVYKVAPGDVAKIWSFYVPTGKKMNDARLVAEINGKEVKTSAVSSDLDIELGQHYRMHCIWNGKSLKWKLSNSETRGLKNQVRNTDVIVCDGNGSDF